MDNENGFWSKQSEIIHNNRKYSYSERVQYCPFNTPMGIQSENTEIKIEQSRKQFFKQQTNTIQGRTTEMSSLLFDLNTSTLTTKSTKLFTNATKSYFSDVQNYFGNYQHEEEKFQSKVWRWHHHLTPYYRRSWSNINRPTTYQSLQSNIKKATSESDQSNHTTSIYQPSRSNGRTLITNQDDQMVRHLQMLGHQMLGHLNINTSELNLIEPKYVEPKKIGVNNKKLGPPKYYIINNWNFDQIGREQPSSRRGSIRDVSALKETFEIFNMKGEIYENLTLLKIKRLMKKISVEDFSENSAIVLVIMTHGGTSSKLYAKDECYFLSEIVDPLLKNQHLNEKPKFIFIEACKGTTDPRMSMETNNSGSDMLIFYSAFENFVSYTDKDYGSYFTQSLCQKLKEKGKSKNIRYICENVIDDVIAKCGKIQTPTLTINLTRNYCFGDYCK